LHLFQRRLTHVLGAVAFLVAIDARAQGGVPFASYRTFETTNFVVTFETGLEEYAQRAAAHAEAAHAQLALVHGSTPHGKIRLVIVDQGDLFNGSASTSPTNRIVGYAHTPVEGDLFFTDDPVELLFTHELAHIFHLDEARRGWRVLRRVFGRGELTFPHLFDGRAVIEGLATFYESRLTDGGRVRGTQFRETLRAAVLETSGPRLDEAEPDPGAWPLDRHYVFGSLFLDHVADQHGMNTVPAWMARRAGSFRSILSRGAGVGELFGGRSLPQAWNNWIATERAAAMQLRERLRASGPGLAATTRLCGVAHHVAYPRVSPDGSRIAFLSTDEGRQSLGLYIADLARCEPRRIARVDSSHAFAWSPDGQAIVFSQRGLVNNARAIADLYRIDTATSSVTRLTRLGRLASPDVHPGGRMTVAVQYDRERSRLVTVDLESGAIAALTEFSTAVAWGPARWSPDGTRLAAQRFTRGRSFDLVLLSADGQVLQSLTDDRALEGIPEWDASAPAGTQRLFFTSDRTGVRELYGLELHRDDAPRFFLAARVATGIHEVAIVPPPPDSPATSIVAVVTHADGRHLERFEIDRAAPIEAALPMTEFASRPVPPDQLPTNDDVATAAYSPRPDLLPRGWSPLFETMDGIGVFAGGMTGSVDVIGRHAWRGTAAYGPGGRSIGSASYAYRRFSHAHLFSQFASTWRVEERVVSEAGEVRRLERKRSASVGVVIPWTTSRQTRLVSASLDVEERRRENTGDAGAMAAADPVRQDPTLVGGGVGLNVGNTQAGLRSISVQDGVRLSASIDYRTATSGDRWRSGWDVAASGYRSLPSWTHAGRPVLAATVRVAQQRGPAAGRLTAGGIGHTAVLDGGSADVEVRGYPTGFVAANALWTARTELRLPIARISRGAGALPLYLRGLSGSWFIDSVGAAGRVDRLGPPQLLSTGAELTSDLTFFSFVPVRIRTGVGVPLKSLGPVSRGEARFYMTAGTSF
jgi:hypothetical protein